MPETEVSPVSDGHAPGAYDLFLAEYLLGIDHRTLIRWAQQDKRGNPPLLPPSRGWAYSFHDLISLAVIAGLRRRGMPKRDIRRVIAYLSEQHGTDRPFARKGVLDTLRHAGSDLLTMPDGVSAVEGGQLTILTTVRQYLRPIKYDRQLWARLWRPSPGVVLDPEVQTGAPVIVNTRVPTATVAGRLEQGERAGEVANDLLLTVAQVRAAKRFEDGLKSGGGLALVS